jgi:hypothetical protein
MVIALVCTLFPSRSAKIQISPMHRRNTIPILSKKGNVGKDILKINENTKVPIAAANAPLEVAFL